MKIKLSKYQSTPKKLQELSYNYLGEYHMYHIHSNEYTKIHPCAISPTNIEHIYYNYINRIL